MASKTFEKFFEDWRGKDLRSSDLTRAPNAAIEMNNLEILENKSLGGRQGIKIVTQPIYIRQVHTYRYTNSDNELVEELIGVGAMNFPGTTFFDGYLYRVVKGTFTIVKVSGAGAGVWSLYHYADSATNTFVFNITDAAGANFLVDNGDGYGASDRTLYTLAAGIDALANYTCTCPKTAIVNGNQVGVSTVTVDAGHTISVGDWVYFVDRATSNKTFHEVVATTATTLTFADPNAVWTFNFNDNDVIGLGNFPAAILDIQERENENSATKTISFYYWERIPNLHQLTTRTGTTPPFKDLAVTPGEIAYMNPSFVNQRQCAYVTAGYALDVQHQQEIGATQTPAAAAVPGLIQKYRSGVWKYDGKDAYLAGLPLAIGTTSAGVNVKMLTLTEGATLALAADTYTYTVSYLYTDARGNIIEYFHEHTEKYAHTTAFCINVQICVPTKDATDAKFSSLYNARAAEVNNGGALYTGVTPPVTAGHTLRTGDTVYYTDFASQELRSVKVTGWTNTTVTVESSISIFDKIWMSTIALRLWRTKAKGSQFFLAFERPCGQLAGRAYETILDNKADNQLGYTIDVVKSDSIQYGLPKGNAITAHQGVLAVAGGKRIANQVFWEDALSVESTDLALQNEVVPSTSGRDVTNLASDTDFGLSVFKPTSQFTLRGSMPESSVEFARVNDTGPGVAGTAALATVDKLNIGVGRRGFIATSGGDYQKDFGGGYAPLFLVSPTDDTEKLVFERAVAFHDDLRHRILFFIPAETEHAGTPAGNSHNTNSKLIVWDFINDVWYDFSYSGVRAVNKFPSGGYAIFEEELWQQTWLYDTVRSAWIGYTHRRMDYSYVTSAFVDNTDPYTWELSPQWDDGGEPKANKVWSDFVIYALQSEFWFEGYDILLETFRNWDTGTVSSTRTLTFDIPTTKELDVKLNANTKAKRMLFKMSGTVFGNPPVLTGYEYVVDDKVYDKKQRFAE